ncbi:hypothetical protein [Methylacidiphilum kamchatkense]|uniref:Uncharacterized protein n=2 Tax=Methylacidiphilum kamchatkense Kam1 TaxID=1202785 RepID=A0A516TLI4_9BACT|nr:hypothetical protein [Methylacidiphilum kamchatkense]QDQ42086.1 hypothetical protein kam1_843 [Methylacidiphilum kamchatkense Kam1]
MALYWLKDKELPLQDSKKIIDDGKFLILIIEAHKKGHLTHSIKEDLMADTVAEEHEKAAMHHEHAAVHYRKAAEHHRAGEHADSGHHAHIAHGHAKHAQAHAEAAAKEEANMHDKKP